MPLSILRPEQPMDTATERKIALLLVLGVPLILGLALLVFASFLEGSLQLGSVLLLGSPSWKRCHFSLGRFAHSRSRVER